MSFTLQYHIYTDTNYIHDIHTSQSQTHIKIFTICVTNSLLTYTMLVQTFKSFERYR